MQKENKFSATFLVKFFVERMRNGNCGLMVNFSRFLNERRIAMKKQMVTLVMVGLMVLGCVGTASAITIFQDTFDIPGTSNYGSLNDEGWSGSDTSWGTLGLSAQVDNQDNSISYTRAKGEGTSGQNPIEQVTKPMSQSVSNAGNAFTMTIDIPYVAHTDSNWANIYIGYADSSDNPLFAVCLQGSNSSNGMYALIHEFIHGNRSNGFYVPNDSPGVITRRLTVLLTYDASQDKELSMSISDANGVIGTESLNFDDAFTASKALIKNGTYWPNIYFDVQLDTLTVDVVPEPTTIGLLAMGALGFIRKR